MNVGVVMLSVSTVVLAASSAYLAHELVKERDRNAAAEAATHSVSPTVGAAAAAPAMAAAPALARSARSASSDDGAAAAIAANLPVPKPIPGTPEHALARQRERNRPQAVEFLRRYDNPQTRQALVDERLDNQRRDLALLRPKLGLDADRWERLVKLLTEQEIDRRVRSARCITDDACVRMDFGAGYGEQQRQAVTDLIGAKNVDQLETFRRQGSQVNSLARFQARLGSKLELTPVQLEELASALADEAYRTRREIDSHDHESASYSTRYGVIVYSVDTDTLEKRMASASASVDRMRDRAGTLLNGEQLTIFNQAQDDALLLFRPYARVGVAARAQGYEP